MIEDGVLIIQRMRVENANAIAGLTWGFPSITNFLGFVHNLSRKLSKTWSLELTGCGVICHDRQVQTYQPRGWGDHVFALSRNPLKAQGKTASFNEEGRMHMTVSLVIPVKGDLEDIEEMEEFKHQLETLIFGQRLAGGTIIAMESVTVEEPCLESKEEQEKFNRRYCRQLLPGFALVQRSDVLMDHFHELRQEYTDITMFDAWLDFTVLKYQANKPEGQTIAGDEVKWQQVVRPGKGWLVPITTGYRGISELYDPGEVDKVRDRTTPFRFVESIYTIGEWVSPHRVRSLDELIWYYRSESNAGWYVCENNYFNTLR